jgi:hypothetical protein
MKSQNPFRKQRRTSVIVWGMLSIRNEERKTPRTEPALRRVLIPQHRV